MNIHISNFAKYGKCDEEEDYFDIFYDSDKDKFVAQGDVEMFEADSLVDLSSSLRRWNRSIDKNGESVGSQIEDNIDYSMSDIKDEDAYYGEFIIHRYFESIY